MQRDDYALGCFGVNLSSASDFSDCAKPRVAEVFYAAIDAVSNNRISYVRVQYF